MTTEPTTTTDNRGGPLQRFKIADPEKPAPVPTLVEMPIVPEMSLAIDKLVPAMCKASLSFGGVHKTKVNPHLRSKYADINAFLNAVTTALCENECLLVQRTVPSRLEDHVAVETMVLHGSGQWIAHTIEMPYDRQNNKTHSVGSSLTYARRYGLQTLLCVGIDEDDDGNQGPQRQASRESNLNAKKELEKAGATPAVPPASRKKPTEKELLRVSLREQALELQGVGLKPKSYLPPDFNVEKATVKQLQEVQEAYTKAMADRQRAIEEEVQAEGTEAQPRTPEEEAEAMAANLADDELERKLEHLVADLVKAGGDPSNFLTAEPADLSAEERRAVIGAIAFELHDMTVRKY